MTCIIGLIDDNKNIHIGADSAGVCGYDIRERTDSKIFIKSSMIFGFTSSFRMGQLIRYQLEIPKHFHGVDDYEYMCTDFIEAVRKCFRDFGFARIDNNVNSGGIFLVGYRGKLYQVESDFQVGQINSNFNACGCGEDYALGALEIIESNSELSCQTPKNKIVDALAVAEKYSAGVSGPFKVLSLTYQG